MSQHIALLTAEHNQHGVLLHFLDHCGAYTHGATEKQALAKAAAELEAYTRWAGQPHDPQTRFTVVTRIEARPDLRLDIADSQALLPGEADALDDEDFTRRCQLLRHSAQCLQRLYDSSADKDCPRLARVDDAYLLSRLNLSADSQRDQLVTNRENAIAALQRHRTQPFAVVQLDGEDWSATKVTRRLLWHDRVRAKALYRHAIQSGMATDELDNAFGFTNQ